MITNLISQICPYQGIQLSRGQKINIIAFYEFAISVLYQFPLLIFLIIYSTIYHQYIALEFQAVDIFRYASHAHHLASACGSSSPSSSASS